MLPYRDSRITRVAIGIFFLIVAGYAYFELHGILYGPTIAVTSDTSEAHDPLTTIVGTASRISSLTMNGQAVSVTEEGAFAEPYLLAPGLNRIVLEVRDKYGRDRREIVQIVYSPPTNSASTSSPQAISPQAATSTPSTVAATTTASSTVAQ